MKAVKVDTKGIISVVDFAPPLNEGLGKLLGGYPEHVRPRRLKQPYCMMVDEEGLFKDLPDNPVGCYLYQTDLHGSPIAGDIYLMKEIPSGGSYDITGLNETDVENLMTELENIPIYKF